MIIMYTRTIIISGTDRIGMSITFMTARITGTAMVARAAGTPKITKDFLYYFGLL